MSRSVWAPNAKSVELVTATGRISLHPCADGHWRSGIEESELKHGYRYSIDGAEPIPDPRSAWQPDGIHGSSHPADFQIQRAAFAAPPLSQAIIYELHVGTFTPEGTYAAAQTKLPHLEELGITHIELMPLATFPGRRGWGYDGVDLYAPFPGYGTPQDLADFIEQCHAHGIGVLLDVVYNHLGPDGNYLGHYGPYFTDRYKTGWGAAVNYDGAHSDAVRRFVIDNALMWLRDYGFDGLRLDAVHAIYSFEATHVLEELTSAVRELEKSAGRRLLVIAESDLNDPRLVRPVSRGGYGLDAQWADDFHHALHRFFTGESDGYYADFNGIEDVAAALRDGYVYQGRYSQHRGRRHGRAPTGIALHQLIVCAQNHDQIGNRARGERLSMLLGAPQLKAIAAMTLLSPFVPLLFQGEEWGAHTPFLYFTDHENPRLGTLVTEGRAKEFSSFGWQGAVPNPQELATFERSKLDWSEPARAAHAELYQWHRELIRLRREKSARLARAAALWREAGVPRTPGREKAAVKFHAQAGWLTFVHGGVLCVFNFAAAAQRVPMPRGEWELTLGSNATEDMTSGEVPAMATLIYRRP